MVIDFNPDRTEMADQRDFLYILADATLEATLSMAHIDQARGLATCPPGPGLIVVAAVHPDGSTRLNPPPDFRIGPDDELIVIGPMGGVDLLFGALGRTEES